MPSLYLHIPFCERKCLYCDFYSVENRTAMDAFLGALGKEIERARERGRGVVFDTIFFGGGTPSLLTPAQLESIMRALHDTYAVHTEAEVTLETNPGTVDRAKLRDYRSLGINRLSVGVQSFHEDELRFLGRIHDRSQAERCVRDGREAGFTNISIDLIYALPGQSAERWEENLQRAVELQPEHLSAYSLIVEDQTPLSRMVRNGEVGVTPPETEAALYERTMSFLADAGYEHYEVSNYARPGRRCRHNVAYWSHEDYIGFGPSAHSFWREDGPASGRRWWNVPSIQTYIERIAAGKLPVMSEERLGSRELVNERIFLGLRSEGIDLARVRGDFRFEFHHRQRELMEDLVAGGLAVVDEGVFRLTPRGYLLCDEISERLML
jgi:oxygen-independent coproporphyrinogen III oxidase